MPAIRQMEPLKNEFGSGIRRHLWQLRYRVIALAVDPNHLVKSSFRFGEVLFSFAVSPSKAEQERQVAHIGTADRRLG